MTRRGVTTALGFDVLAVLLFAIVGRASHASGLEPGGVLGTAAPFLVGLGIGWAVAIGTGVGRRAPRRIRGTGLIVLGGALLGGFPLRWLSGGGVPVPFAAVTVFVLAVLILGWRACTLVRLPFHRPRIKSART